jgi:hypothetical protein
MDVPTTGDCAGIPTIPHDHPPDTLNLTRDPTLEAKFPDLIDGMPVGDVASGKWIETLCTLGGQASVDTARANVPAGTDLAALTVGSGQTVVDGLAVTITAFRLPGHQGAELIPMIGGLSSALTGSAPKFTSDLEDVTVGGKSVKRWTNAADGQVSYLYSSGDTLFVIEGVTPSQADKVVAGLG